MDIDIDLKTSFDPLDYFDTAVRASMVRDGKLVKHPAGAYFQYVPLDRITKLSAIPYKQAEAVGFNKIDFLHLNFLEPFSSKQQLIDYSRTEPDWSLLLDETVVKTLSHIHKYSKLVKRLKPTSIDDLADVLALIRPSKKGFVDSYLINKGKIRERLYTIDKSEGFAFKKSHAIAYAHIIVVELNVIREQKHETQRNNSNH